MHKRSLLHTCAFGLMLPWARFACRLRDIFIDERRSHGHAEGPLDHQSCLAMGNSERAWTEFYDKHYQKRERQAGIQAMSAWRATMLSKSIPNNTPSAEVFDVDDSE